MGRPFTSEASPRDKELVSALLRAAEAHAVANGATIIEIQASLAAVQFYERNGYEKLGSGETKLMSGHPIACAFMQKTLSKGSL
jgi:hypothetical protein